MPLSIENIDEAPVIPVGSIELVGLQFVANPAPLSLYLDFTDNPSGRPKLKLLLSKGEDDCLELEMDQQLPLGRIPDTTLQLSELLNSLWGSFVFDNIEELFARVCAEMVLTVLKLKVEALHKGKVRFTCSISGYEGETVCELTDLYSFVQL